MKPQRMEILLKSAFRKRIKAVENNADVFLNKREVTIRPTELEFHRNGRGNRCRAVIALLI